jgi:hypothetical protein
MSSVKATWINGQVVLEGPALWREGSRLLVSEDSLRSDDDREENAESIARWIAEFDAIEPLEMTAQEEADWQAAREAQRELEKTTASVRAENIQRAWE